MAPSSSYQSAAKLPGPGPAPHHDHGGQARKEGSHGGQPSWHPAACSSPCSRLHVITRIGRRRSCNGHRCNRCHCCSGSRGGLRHWLHRWCRWHHNRRGRHHRRSDSRRLHLRRKLLGRRLLRRRLLGRRLLRRRLLGRWLLGRRLLIWRLFVVLSAFPLKADAVAVIARAVTCCRCHCRYRCCRSQQLPH